MSVPIRIARGLNTMHPIQTLIEESFENAPTSPLATASPELKSAVMQVIDELDSGRIRVAEKHGDDWVVNQWVKSRAAVVPHPRQRADGRRLHAVLRQGGHQFADYTEREFREGGFRVVPNAVARRGSFIGKNVLLMPSYEHRRLCGRRHHGGHLATVGSCAQIGKNVHLSGGVGIGGVLEPLQANPTIIEDNRFIGARARKSWKA